VRRRADAKSTAAAATAAKGMAKGSTKRRAVSSQASLKRARAANLEKHLYNADPTGNLLRKIHAGGGRGGMSRAWAKRYWKGLVLPADRDRSRKTLFAFRGQKYREWLTTASQSEIDELKRQGELDSIARTHGYVKRHCKTLTPAAAAVAAANGDAALGAIASTQQQYQLQLLADIRSAKHAARMRTIAAESYLQKARASIHAWQNDNRNVVLCLPTYP
jgi:hypothetical protein